MKTSISLVSIATLIMLAMCAGCAWAQVDDEYLLQRSVKVGETDKYKTNLKIQGTGPMGPLSFEVTIISNDKVTEVKPNGEFALTITIESGTMVINGSDRPFPGAGQSITVTYDKMGHTIGNSAPTTGRGSMIAQLLPIPRMGYLTDKPIKVGQSARYETEFGDGKKNKLSGLINLQSVEKAGTEIPLDTVKVKSSADILMPGPMGDQKTHIESIGQIDPKNGKVYKSEGTVTGGPLAPLGNDAKLTFKLTRIGVGDGASK